jgi:cell division protein FtsA
MAKEVFYTAIDVGTNKVCTIVATIGAEGDLKVLGIGIVPSQGVQKGRVESIPEAQEAVKASLAEAQRYLGRGIPWAYVGITGSHISCLNTTSALSGRGNEAVSSEDVAQLIQSSYPEVDESREVLHVIPMSYVVDGLAGVRNPVNLSADKVQVECHVVLGEASILRNVVRALEGCKLEVRSLVHQPMAAAEAVLTEDEREMGVMLVDIGGGTTDIIVFKTGSPWYTAVLPVGGNQFTRDLSVALGVPFHMAEQLKTKHGHAILDSLAIDEEVNLPGFQGQPAKVVKRRDLCEPINERAMELIKLVVGKVHEAGLRQLPPGGLVLTGGAAELSGLRDLAKKATGVPVRVGYPQGILGLPAQLRKPAYSASVGTLLWGIKHQGVKRIYKNGNKTLGEGGSFTRRFSRNKVKAAA